MLSGKDKKHFLTKVFETIRYSEIIFKKVLYLRLIRENHRKKIVNFVILRKRTLHKLYNLKYTIKRQLNSAQKTFQKLAQNSFDFFKQNVLMDVEISPIILGFILITAVFC